MNLKRVSINILIMSIVLGGVLLGDAFAKEQKEPLNYKGQRIIKPMLVEYDKGTTQDKEVSKVNLKLVDEKKVLIKWDKDNDLDGYLIYRKEGNKEVLLADVKENADYTDDEIKTTGNKVYTIKPYKNILNEKSFAKAVKEEIKVPEKKKEEPKETVTSESTQTSQSNSYRQSTTRRTVSTPSYTSVPAGNGNSSLIAFARTKLGYPYVYGASGPSAFDCSGFVYYVTKNAGSTRVGRSSAASMYSSLRQYSVPGGMSNVRPGDLVFVSYGGGISHVGFYYGGGKLIHAVNPSTGVAITPIWGTPVGVVRLP